MHFEILIEDQSEKKALDIIVPKILGDKNTFKVHAYKGIGRIPKNLEHRSDASKRILLERLPKLLQGYGSAFKNYPNSYKAAVIIVCDLDDRCLKMFRKELFDVLNACHPAPETYFCVAIEEGEAWLLGDIQAIKTAYPRAKDSILNAYVNDSICGTWEYLADAVVPGGAQALSSKGWQAIGAQKAEWSEKITPHMDTQKNSSPSFNYFKDKILEITRQTNE